MQIPSLCREDPLQKEMATHSSILAWKSCGQSSLEGYSPWGCKESYTTGHLSTLDVKQIRSLFLSILGLSVLPFNRWLSNNSSVCCIKFSRKNLKQYCGTQLCKIVELMTPTSFRWRMEITFQNTTGKLI